MFVIYSYKEIFMIYTLCIPLILGDRAKRHSTSSIRPPQRFKQSDEELFKPRGKHLRAPIMSTTDTEPEMKEFNLGPIGNADRV